MNRMALLALSLGVLVPAFGQNYPPSDRGEDSRGYQDSRDRDYRDSQNGNYANSIPAGTQIRVRTNEAIDVRDRSDGRIYTGRVDENVTNSSGTVIIPRGATAELIVNNLNENEMAVDVESITVNGRRYMVSAEAYDKARAGLGKNKRTGEYVGSGAALGSIIGAIAGGGKGAAIGALAGAGAGAGAQTMTRGRAVRVPAESVLTFRLEQPFQLGRNSRDYGYDRDGHHYHSDYYSHENGTDRREAPPQY
ncbi:MAG: hypothetical protein JOZ62_03000 [Acidobacteriaceae bacterium]|nr:hypothetical protein [Acidobacteriaceae bacterium]